MFAVAPGSMKKNPCTFIFPVGVGDKMLFQYDPSQKPGPRPLNHCPHLVWCCSHRHLFPQLEKQSTN